MCEGKTLNSISSKEVKSKLFSYRSYGDDTTKISKQLSKKSSWNAVSLLGVDHSIIPDEDKLFLVLTSELIESAELLHKFACDVAEHLAEYVKRPMSKGMAAIQAKRDWLSGKLDDSELNRIRDVAKASINVDSTDPIKNDITRAAILVSEPGEYYTGVKLALRVSTVGARIAKDVTGGQDAERRWQVIHLIELLKDVN